MPDITQEHFERAAADLGAHGGNDTLPFDIDTRFVSEKKQELAHAAYKFFDQLQRDSVANSLNKVAALNVFSERLLVASRPSGFRVTTKIQPFWKRNESNSSMSSLHAGTSNLRNPTYIQTHIWRAG